LVGLVEVDLRPQEVARPERVPLAADTVGLGCPGRELAEHVGELGVGGAGARGTLGEPVGQRTGGLLAAGTRALGERAPERAVAREVLGLLDAAVHLAARGDPAALGGVPQRDGVALQRGRHGVHAVGDRGPVVLGGGRHEVEHLAHGLQRRGDDVEVAVQLAGLEQLEQQPQTLLHRGDRDAVDVVDRLGAGEGVQGGAGRVGLCSQPVGGVVVQLAVVAAEPEVGGGDRAQPDDLVDVGVGDPVDGGGLACSRGHPCDPIRLRAVARPGPDGARMGHDAVRRVGARRCPPRAREPAMSSPQTTRLPATDARRLGFRLHLRGETAEAAAVYDSALLDDADETELALFYAAAASTSWAQGDLETCRSRGALAMAHAERTGDDEALGWAWTAQALLATLDGDPHAEGFAYARASRRAAREQDVDTQVRVFISVSDRVTGMGSYKQAITQLERAFTLLDEHPQPLMEALAHENLGRALLGLGRLDEALEQFEQARHRWLGAGAPQLRTALLGIGDTYLALGNASQAASASREVI